MDVTKHLFLLVDNLIAANKELHAKVKELEAEVVRLNDDMKAFYE